MTDEPELQGCEHCDNAFDIDHMTLSGDVWLCPACVIAWDKAFAACQHEWEVSTDHGEAGKYCPKCSGFVEDYDFAAFYPDHELASQSAHAVGREREPQ